MDLDQRFKDWFLSQDKTSQTDSIKKFAIRLNSLKKKVDKASDAELNYGFNRVGIRGGKFTTLNARTHVLCQQYSATEEELKFMIKNL